MKTVREGWVVFGPDGSMLTGPHVIEYYAWCQAGYTWSKSIVHCKNMGYTCEYVEVAIQKKQPPAKQTAGEMIQALRDAGLSAWDDVTIEELDQTEKGE